MLIVNYLYTVAVGAVDRGFCMAKLLKRLSRTVPIFIDEPSPTSQDDDALTREELQTLFEKDLNKGNLAFSK